MEFLQNNQFTAGLMLTTVLAAILAYARNIPNKLVRFFWSFFSVTVEIKNTDMAFKWLSEWLDKQPYSKTSRNITIFTYYDTAEDDDNVTDLYYDINHPRKRQKNKPKILFTPAKGTHWFRYNKHFIWLSREVSESVNNGKSSTKTEDRETISITILGRKQDLIRDIINEAMSCALPAEIVETVVVMSANGSWSKALRRKPRTGESVILKGDQLNILVDDVKQFLISKDWYDDLSIPYRKGYLLYGQPGSGKTSAVLAVAGVLGLDVYLLSLTGPLMDDNSLNTLMSQVPPRSIILLEDIDAVFVERKSGDANIGHITFSGLLNAIDGVASTEGRILFMTTNFKEKLDAALIRPGRADMHIEFTHATKEQAKRMFKRFYPSADEKYLVDKFEHLTPEGMISMAAIQDHLLTHKNDPVAAVNNWPAKVQNLLTN